jgi:hypothetical protein
MKKRRGNRNEQALVVKKPAPDKTDSQAVTTHNASTQEQLVDEVVKSACKVTGTRSLNAADRFIVQTGNALVWPKPKDADDHIVRASALIAELAPKNAIEAMIATQMIATNDAALMFLNRATLSAQHPDAIDTNVQRATRLMRVFTEQLEAMQKLKGKAGHQKVTVEHVHVHQGGQAIVGTVTTGEPGGRDDREDR